MPDCNWTYSHTLLLIAWTDCYRTMHHVQFCHLLRLEHAMILANEISALSRILSTAHLVVEFSKFPSNHSSCQNITSKRCSSVIATVSVHLHCLEHNPVTCWIQVLQLQISICSSASRIA